MSAAGDDFENALLFQENLYKNRTDVRFWLKVLCLLSYKKASQPMVSVTGQWSLPIMSMQMPASRMRGASRSLTRK